MNTDKLKELAESAQWISDQVEKNSENPLSYMMQRQIMTAFYTTFTPELALSLIKEQNEIIKAGIAASEALDAIDAYHKRIRPEQPRIPQSVISALYAAYQVAHKAKRETPDG